MDFAKSWERCDSIMRSLSICPAQAGVIPFHNSVGIIDNDLSRASGGDPILFPMCALQFQFVPRKRG